MVSKVCPMSKLGTAVNWKHVTVIILQKFEIIVMTAARKIRREFVASYNFELSNIYDMEKWKD